MSKNHLSARGIVCWCLIFCTSAIAPAQDKDFTLRLTDTDLRSLIDLVSRQTGTTFVVDPRVQGIVNVVSHAPVTEGTLYEIFLSVLQIHGFAAIPSGPVTKIVPDAVARKGAIPLNTEVSPNSGDQLVSEVIKLKHISAVNLFPAVRSLIPQEGQLEPVPESNSLVITDRRSNIQRIKEIINFLDNREQEKTEILSLRHASASQVASLLSGLQQGFSKSDPMQLVADDRSNSVIILGSSASRDRTRRIVAQLDVPLTSNRNTRVVTLKFADAEKIAAILRSNAKGSSMQPQPQPQGPSQSQVPSRGIVPIAPQPQEVDSLPTSTNLVVQSLPEPMQNGSATEMSQIQINADPDTNSIIITGSSDQIANNIEIINLLDVRRAQVRVEAVIAEITEDSILELGVSFLASDHALAGYANLGDGAESALGLTAALQSEQLPDSLATGLSLAVGQMTNGGLNFGLLLRALRSDSDNNILSTPTIVTLDNEEAEIAVGSNVPFLTGQQLSSNNDNPFQTIERQDVGLRLKVKPQINDDSTIKLTIEQEVSSVNPTALTGAVDITTSQRSLKTTVLVEDGQPLVLGGLIDEVHSDAEEKVPLLGDIPLVGNLFRHKVTTKRKTNLVVFLRPVIMRDGATASSVSQQQLNKMRDVDLTRFRESSTKRHGAAHSPEVKIENNYTNASRPQVDDLIDSAVWQEMPDGSLKLLK